MVIPFLSFDGRIAGVLIASGLVLALGLIDDIKRLRWLIKMMGVT